MAALHGTDHENSVLMGLGKGLRSHCFNLSKLYTYIKSVSCGGISHGKSAKVTSGKCIS